MNRTTVGPNGFGMKQLAVAQDFFLQSKDKRHQMHAPEVKQYILEDNMRRNKDMFSQKAKDSTDQYEFKLGDTMP